MFLLVKQIGWCGASRSWRWSNDRSAQVHILVQFAFHSSLHLFRQHSIWLLSLLVSLKCHLSFYFQLSSSLLLPSVTSLSALSKLPAFWVRPVLVGVSWSVIRTLTIIGTGQMVRPPSPQVIVKMSRTLGDRWWNDDMPNGVQARFLTCQLMRLDRFSTTSRYSVRVGGPYL